MPHRFAPALLLLAATAACSPAAREPRSPKPSADAASAPPSATAPAVPLEIADWNAVRDAIAAHRGDVVVLDIWSTSCIPCIREFPNLVRLHQTHGDRVVCMSLNVDYIGLKDRPPESYRKPVSEFLERQGARFPNFLCSEPDIALYEKLDLASIPAVFVYDRDGKLRKRFDNDQGQYGDEGFTYEQHVIPFVEQLLEE